jgi:hypothetical protein
MVTILNLKNTLLILVLFTCMGLQAKYKYNSFELENSSKVNSLAIIPSNEGILFGDAVVIAKFLRNEMFKCSLESPYVNLAIPNNINKSNVEWEFAGDKFERRHNIELSILGKKLNVIPVDVYRNEKLQIRFFYSTEEGVIGFYKAGFKNEFFIAESNGWCSD